MSDNENIATTDRNKLLDETIVSLRRMKEYAKPKGVAHNVFVTPKTVQLLGEVKNSKYLRQRIKKRKKRRC